MTDADGAPTDPQGLWTALLAKWTELAQASLGLPSDGDGGRWRASLASIINLQAITHALQEFRRSVDGVDRAVAIDKADLIFAKATAELHEVWRGEAMPDGIVETIDDARAALTQSATNVVVWLNGEDVYVGEDPTAVAIAAVGMGFTGLCLFASPGVPMFAGAPLAVLKAKTIPAQVERLVASALDGAGVGPLRAGWAAQVYRQYDFGAGRAVRDVVAPLDGEPVAGQPLLTPICEGGELLPVRLAPRGVDPTLAELPVEIAPDAGPFLLDVSEEDA